MRKVNLKQFYNLKISIGCNEMNEVLSEDEPQPDLSDFIGMDIRDRGQEIIWDLLDGIPVPDLSCKYLWVSHILEHVGADEIEDIMDEFWRVLQVRGTLEIRSPDISSSTSLNPTHKQQLDQHYFNHFMSPSIKEYGHQRWLVVNSYVYKRVGDKRDIRVIMTPIR